MINLKDPVICGKFFKYTHQPGFIGVSYKYLAKVILCHQVDNLFHPVCIKFIKNIVQKKDWRDLS